MSHSEPNKNRRTILKVALTGAAAVPLGTLVLQSRALAGDMPHLSPDDPAAKALGYVNDASQANNPKHQEGQFCKNCNLVRSDSGEWRACAIFPGKAVHESGWCSAWVRKA